VESREATWRKPLATEATSREATCGCPALPEGVDSTRKNGLTFLAPLTYPLIIEELRPEDTPRGRFSFPHIADSGPAAGHPAARVSTDPPYIRESHHGPRLSRRARSKPGRSTTVNAQRPPAQGSANELPGVSISIRHHHRSAKSITVVQWLTLLKAFGRMIFSPC
jgi:hypothetical protein